MSVMQAIATITLGEAIIILLLAVLVVRRRV